MWKEQEFQKRCQTFLDNGHQFEVTHHLAIKDRLGITISYRHGGFRYRFARVTATGQHDRHKVLELYEDLEAIMWQRELNFL